jgi:hypothetical protein
MLKASAIPEVWPAGPATRPCHGSYFIHPLSAENQALQVARGEYSGPVYYDNYGHCVPGASTLILPAVDTGLSIGTILLVVGVAIGGYYLYKNRKRIFA